MNLLEPDVVESCRERNGHRKEERASRIDEALLRPKLGHRNGKPIVDGFGYEDYPSRDDLSQPQWKGFLQDLLGSRLVTSYEDAAEELTSAGDLEERKWVDALERAVGLFNLDADALFDEGEVPDEDRLTKILGKKPAEAVISADNPLLVAEMYRLGMGIAGINEVLSDYDDESTEEIVRESLKRGGLIDGEVTETVDRSKSMTMEEYDTRLGGTTVELDDGDEIKRRAKEANNITVR
jgi:hypothetical protein